MGLLLERCGIDDSLISRSRSAYIAPVEIMTACVAGPSLIQLAQCWPRLLQEMLSWLFAAQEKCCQCCQAFSSKKSLSSLDRDEDSLKRSQERSVHLILFCSCKRPRKDYSFWQYGCKIVSTGTVALDTVSLEQRLLRSLKFCLHWRPR